MVFTRATSKYKEVIANSEFRSKTITSVKLTLEERNSRRRPDLQMIEYDLESQLDLHRPRLFQSSAGMIVSIAAFNVL